uniref:Sulfotransferase n=1 Tax=Denticeps clupeoides TaxID=299321 RepID=A0AAY4DBV5_9TELE
MHNSVPPQKRKGQRKGEAETGREREGGRGSGQEGQSVHKEGRVQLTSSPKGVYINRHVRRPSKGCKLLSYAFSFRLLLCHSRGSLVHVGILMVFCRDQMHIPRPDVFDFEGITMIHYFTDNWEKVQNFQARPNDILIATYPKAGTTWVSYILDLLYFGQQSPERQSSLPIYERVPFLEFAVPVIPPGTELADKLQTSPRLIKTHLPVQLVPKSFWEQNCRVVYVGRNAKDNAVSYFHFDRMNSVQPEPGDWNGYIEKFMAGNTVFGPWYDHVIGWWEKKKSYSNLLYLFFEDLVEDTGRELEHLCSFLGLSTPIEERERIREGVQFDAMKKNPMANYSTIPVMDFKISPFMRKGKVGDWKNHFTVAQNETFDQHYKRWMKDTTLTFRTEL